MSPSGLVIIREVNPVPGPLKWPEVVPAPKIKSLAVAVVAEPLLAVEPVPAVPTAAGRSRGFAVSPWPSTRESKAICFPSADQEGDPVAPLFREVSWIGFEPSALQT